MEKEEVLQRFGLTEAEVRLYISLLQMGAATASSLARKTGANRTFTYDRLSKLISKGLVSTILKQGKKHFIPAEPRHFLELLKEDESRLAEILPELEGMRKISASLPVVELFSSKKGIRTALNIMLEMKKEILVHGTIIRFRETIPEYFHVWNARREKENIALRVLTSEEIDLPFSELSLLSEEESSAITTFCCDDVMLIVLWSENPVGIRIRSRDFALDYSSFFNNVWNREIKIYTGVAGIRRAWMELVSSPSDELVGFGFSWDLARIYGREFSNRWHAERLRNKIPCRLIAYNDPKSRKYFDFRMIEWPSFNIRFLDSVLCGPACVTMSDNLIVTFIYTEKRFRVVLSRNREMISAYRKHFKKLWELTFSRRRRPSPS